MRPILSLDEYLAKARKYAEQADILGMAIALDTSSLISTRQDKDISSIRTQIEYIGYSNATYVLLDETEHHLTQNNIDEALKCFTDAKNYAAKTNQDIQSRVRTINELIYN